MKRIQLEPWTAFDKHCLTSAVSRVGDQNWTAVSRATRNIYEDSIKWLAGGEKRSLEWFSNKQCAAQYEHLLKNVPPRRKKRSERSADQANVTESPSEILQQTCRHEFVEELKRTLAEEQTQYLKLLKEYEDILAGRLDHKLEDIQEEYEAKEREKEIKIKLKFKLGEKNQTETPPVDHDRPTPPTELPTTPIKSEKDTGHETPRTSVTTSPLLTSLLQSPSPLTRTSATPTISLLLNTSPPVPANESPTLSKLLETSCPIGPTPPPTHHQPSSSSSGMVRPHTPSSTPPIPRSLATSSTPLSALINPVTPSSSTVTPQTPSPQVQIEVPTPKKDTTPTGSSGVKIDSTVKKDEAKEINKSTESILGELVKSVIKSDKEARAIAPIEDDTKKKFPRRLDLDSLVLEEETTREFEVMETVEEMIEKVQTAIIETVGDEGSIQDVRDLSTVAESETTTVEEHSLDTLELTSDAVELIVMGPDRPPCIEVNRDTDSIKDDESKEDNIEEDVLDIDEIQPSISATDIAHIEDMRSPLKDRLAENDTCGKDVGSPTVKMAQSPLVTIEQVEADLAAITREEEEQEGLNRRERELAEAEIVEKLEKDDEIIIPDEIVDKVEEVEEVEKLKELPVEPKIEPEQDVEIELKQEEVVEETITTSTEEKIETIEIEETEHLPEPVTTTEPEEVKSIDEETQLKDMPEDEIESQIPETSQEPIEPPELEEVTVSTDNTNDSAVEKTTVEDDDKDVQEQDSEISEDEKKPETPIKAKEETDKPKIKISERTPSKMLEEKGDSLLEDKVEELRTSKRDGLRRGRATPPVMSPATPSPAVSDRTLREKRPLTPSSSSDGKEEPTPRTVKRKRTTNVSESSVPCSPSPSIVSNDDDKDYRVWKKSILLVYDRIAAHKYASVFLKPISENDAPGYFQLIQFPTDLTTIKRQIESGVIRNTVDFQKEMLLMISNAIIYNKSDTLVHKMACEMLPDMKEAMETMVQALGSGVPLDQQDSRPPVTARVSRASVSKGQTSDDASTPTPSNTSTNKRKRTGPPPEDIKSKRKRSDAS